MVVRFEIYFLNINLEYNYNVFNKLIMSSCSVRDKWPWSRNHMGRKIYAVTKILFFGLRSLQSPKKRPESHLKRYDVAPVLGGL